MSNAPVSARPSTITSFQFDTGSEKLELKTVLAGVTITHKTFVELFGCKMSLAKGVCHGKVLTIGDDITSMRQVLAKMGRNGSPTLSPMRLVATQIQATLQGKTGGSLLDADGNRNIFFSRGAGGMVCLIEFCHNGTSKLDYTTWPYWPSEPRAGDRFVWMP